MFNFSNGYALVSACGAVATCMALAGHVLPANAQISIGAGSVIDLGTSAVDIGCLDLGVDGTLNIQSGTYTGINHLLLNTSGVVDGGTGVISLSGDFARNGSFNAASGEYRSVDGCLSGGTTFTANNTFYRLSVSTAIGRTLNFPGNSTQTVQQALSLTGTAGNLLQLRSLVAGSQAYTNLLAGASQTIDYVDVADNHAIGQAIAPDAPAAFNSVQGSNTDRWFLTAAAETPVPVPTLSLWLLGLLGVLIVALGARFGQPYRRNSQQPR